MKRLIDVLVSFFGLLLFGPVLVIFLLLIWLQDFHSPFYIAPRMRRKGLRFDMFKLRSMVVNASQIGGTSTAVTDNRITWVGRMIRRYKLDEFSQLWNVLIGDMSLVGPRPQTERDASLYSDEEDHLFEVRPGITDFSSIVFSDEGDILAGSNNADLMYNQVIRPWKSRLGLFYVYNHNIWIDLQVIILTVISIVSRPIALKGVQRILKKLGASESLIEISGRSVLLAPSPPPGYEVVETRY
ncbi:sugar transferase [bacterium]|nr:sugar transferase [bacterium]